jgi:hypothetical protein
MGGGCVSVDQIKSLASDLQRRRTTNWATSGMSVLGYDDLNRYYTATQPIQFLHEEVREQTNGRLKCLAINWARVIVGAIEERLDVEGFRVGDQASEDDLWRMWQANNLDEWSQLGHTDSMVNGRAFGIAWGDEEDPTTPRLTVESATQVTCQYVPGTTELAAAAKFYNDNPGELMSEATGWLYLPDRVERYRGTVRGTGFTTWAEDGPPLPNPLGVVPVVPLVNRPKLTDLCGESELTDVIPILDAVNKLGTDMMVSSEYHSMPRRWATNMTLPRDRRARNELRSAAREEWDELQKGRTMLGGKGVAFGQFAEAQLDNYINAIKLLVSQIAAIAGLPPHYLGISADNPASADAIRSAESSLVKKAFRKQRSFGGGWERLMRLAVAIRDGIPYDQVGAAFQAMETQWADPNTSSPGVKADAAIKLVASTPPIIDVQQAQEDLGYSPQQIERMEDRKRAAVQESAVGDVRAKLALAQELQATHGLSTPAAYATVGLFAGASQMSAPPPAVIPPSALA